MNAEEAKIASEDQKKILIEKQIKWVELFIDFAIKDGKKFVERTDEHLYKETITHFESLGYKVNNGRFVCDTRHFMPCEADFDYWHVSWKET